jgi:glutaredoxin
MKNAIIVLAFAAAALLSLQSLDARGQDHRADAGGYRQDCGSDAGPAEGVRLYIRPNPIPIPEPEPEREDLARTHPEIAEAEGAIVVFGAAWCQWCKAELSSMEDSEAGSTYRIVALDIDQEKHKALMNKWGLGDTVPVTVIVERGVIVKRFDGYVGWDKIKPHANKAKKNEDEQKDSNGFWVYRNPWGRSDLDLDRQRKNRRRY